MFDKEKGVSYVSEDSQLAFKILGPTTKVCGDTTKA